MMLELSKLRNCEFLTLSGNRKLVCNTEIRALLFSRERKRENHERGSQSMKICREPDNVVLMSFHDINCNYHYFSTD